MVLFIDVRVEKLNNVGSIVWTFEFNYSKHNTFHG